MRTQLDSDSLERLLSHPICRRPREYESAAPDYYPDPLSPNKRPRTGGPYDGAPADYAYGAPPPGPSPGQAGAPPGFGALPAYGVPEAPGYAPAGPIIWHGTLAKSGTTVCKARCFAIGKAPEVLM